MAAPVPGQYEDITSCSCCDKCESEIAIHNQAVQKQSQPVSEREDIYLQRYNYTNGIKAMTLVISMMALVTNLYLELQFQPALPDTQLPSSATDRSLVLS